MPDDNRNTGVYMLVGFLAGSLTLGLMFLLVAKAFSLLRQPQLGPGAQQPINVYNTTGGGAQPVPIQPSNLSTQMQLGHGVSMATRTDTVELSTARSSRVFSAPRQGAMWHVRLHVIGPAGSFAAFAIDSTPSAAGGNSLVIAAGGHTEVRIGPRQAISGIAVNSNTDVSYVASAEVV